MFFKLVHYASEYLRINAIRRMLGAVDVRTSEITLLVALAAVFAVFEGLGISLLLPILQYAESGQTAITATGGGVWAGLHGFMEFVGLPVILPILLIMAFVPILMRQLVFYLNTWYSAVVAGRIGVRIRMKALDAVLDADPEFFTRQSAGHLVGIVVTQTVMAGHAIIAVIRQLSITFLMLLYIVILLALSVPLTMITLVFAVLVSIVVKSYIRKIRDFGVEAAEVTQEMIAKIVERIGMMRLVKLRHQKQSESKRIEEYSEKMRAISVKQARLGAMIEVTADPLLMLSAFATLYIGIDVLGMTLAQLGLLLFVLNRLNAKVKEFNAGRQAISMQMAGLLLVQEAISDAKISNTIRGGEIPFEGLSHDMVLSDVSFAYPEVRSEDGLVESAEKEVLRDISLTIPAGSFTAIVGRSGVGKSTLVELFPRLRDVTTGNITIDGTDIRQFQLGSLRRGIGYLTQDAMLFNDSVRENLTYGLGFNPTDEQLRTALEQAYATFVYNLPSGTETRLGDRGIRLSGGERQRIALARVLLSNCSVLILDEPTSALDSESEAYIQRALAELRGKKTIIVIAHRLATVIKADQLLVMEDGRIVERGTHEELMTCGATYQRLFETQLLG
ncbi:MAG: ABC transporter ATP-binding protein/permease [Actinobacteria bacterium]|nr:ABC transporter ATP-binding protein/permease [Actinomycetota bacterium]